MVIIAIDVLTPDGTLPTITSPPSDGVHPPFHLISATTVSNPATMEQFLYWKMVGSGETGAAPSFTFTFDGTFRATGVGINYNGTCTEDAVPCSDPISDTQIGTSVTSNAVSSLTAVNVPANGVALAAFGTTNTGTFFGESGTPSGAVIPSLASENNNAGKNAGFALYDQFESSTGSYGPFTASLPNLDTGDNIAQAIGIIPQ